MSSLNLSNKKKTMYMFVFVYTSLFPPCNITSGSGHGNLNPVISYKVQLVHKILKLNSLSLGEDFFSFATFDLSLKWTRDFDFEKDCYYSV